MEPLELSLKRAARAADWQREVVHRCAWCRRVATAEGAYVEMLASDADPAGTVVTDGMCPHCGLQALDEITRRRTRKAA